MATTNIQNTIFEIPKDGYLAFDALSLKQLIVENLNKTGVFTDQNYEASYLSNIINIIAYSYNALMFYLNKTSSEAMFTEAQIYENMNRIVKMLGYNPVGYQTALLSFILKAASLKKGVYIIPRYSYFIKNGIAYSFNEDIVFNKTVDDQEEILTDINNSKLLYQGRFFEYPTYTAIGQENESLIFTVEDNVLLDHFNIFIYRYDVVNRIWEQWEKTENLFLERSDSKKYEIRLNPEQNYEIKFGNNINGLKLNTNDLIAIYYLQSDGSAGEIGSNEINEPDYVRFFTTQFNDIYQNVNTTNATIVTDTTVLVLENPSPSTRSKGGETPDQIRESAPSLFKTQYRLVTANDFKVFILNNFANFIQDATVSNNWEYVAERLKYYYDLGLTTPDKAGAPLFAQVNFADSCNFNNIYITAAPKISIQSAASPPYLSVAQKQLIINSIKPRKPLTTEIVIIDPVYIAVDVALPDIQNKFQIQDIENTNIIITKTSTTKRTDDDIRADIIKIFADVFAQNELKLGQTINLSNVLSQINSIQGVSRVETINIINNARVPGLTFYRFDPIYPATITPVAIELKVENFQFAYFYNIENLANRIVFEQRPSIYENIEI